MRVSKAWGAGALGAGDWGLLDPLASAAGAAVDDTAILTALVEVENALTAAWVDAGFAPAWVAELELTAALDLPVLSRGNRDGGNPVIPLVTQLRAQAETFRPGAGGWVHRGATSQDILDTALMLVASHAAAAVSDSLGTVATALAALANQHRHDLMAGRTLTQQAAPITFGVKAASWLDGADSALAAITALRFPVQLAGSVGTGAAFADLAESPEAGQLLRAALAARLGLTDPARSWQAERTPVVSVAAALALAVGVLGRIAADILILTRTEVGEVSEGSAGSSSAMPQKQNPTTAVLIHSAALQTPGLLATVYSSLIVDDERPAGAWHAEWLALRSLLRLAIETSEAAETLVASIVVDADRMRANLDAAGGLAWAEHAQSQLTAQVGREAAAAIVVRAIAAVSAEVSFPEALLAEAGGDTVDLSPQSIFSVTDVVIDAALARHASRGGRS